MKEKTHSISSFSTSSSIKNINKGQENFVKKRRKARDSVMAMLSGG
jgi:asparagine synthetase B (glutamine-hydrolysing)